MILSRPDLEAALRSLPRPLVGSLAFDHRDRFNLRDNCVAMIEECVAIARPKRILEIGTHLGHSGCLWLGLSDAHLVSVDIGTNWVTWEHGWADWGSASAGGGLREVVANLTARFPGRFTFVLGDSNDPSITTIISSHGPYDLAFIDGDHSYEYVLKDIQNAQALGIPHIVLDDCTSPHEDTWRAALDAGLKLVKHYPSIHNTANIGAALWTIQ